MQPITIGISSYSKKISMNFSGNQSATLVPTDYLSLFERNNVLPLILSPSIPLDHVDEVCHKIDGLFLIGGEDIDPALYNEESRVQYADNTSSIGTPYHRPALLRPNPQRDAFEMALYTASKKRNLPIIGNCRGMQLINVAEGGSLFQEIPPPSLAHLISPDGWAQHHEVSINPQSTWGRLLGRDVYTTSSSHHQAIKRVASSLQAVGTSSDGVIEMIEYQDSSHFILGLQGHIEKLVENFEHYRNVINEFVHVAEINKRASK